MPNKDRASQNSSCVAEGRKDACGTGSATRKLSRLSSFPFASLPHPSLAPFGKTGPIHYVCQSLYSFPQQCRHRRLPPSSFSYTRFRRFPCMLSQTPRRSITSSPPQTVCKNKAKVYITHGWGIRVTGLGARILPVKLVVPFGKKGNGRGIAHGRLWERLAGENGIKGKSGEARYKNEVGASEERECRN